VLLLGMILTCVFFLANGQWVDFLGGGILAYGTWWFINKQKQ
jgi:hypothetical protein